MGGISGLIYSSLPVLVFVPVSSLFGLLPAIGAALGVAALILVWRLVRRESAQPAISGFIGVGVCALIAYVMGESKGYFLLGIWSSLFWAAVFALSVLIRRPVVGYIWGWVNGHDRGWRRVRRAVLAFDIATFTWVLVFGVAVRRAAPPLRRRPDRLAGRGPHRDGLAVDRSGGAGDLSGHPGRPAGPARARGRRTRGDARRTPRTPTDADNLTSTQARGRDRRALSRSRCSPPSWRSWTARWSTSRCPRSAGTSAAAWRCSSGWWTDICSHSARSSWSRARCPISSAGCRAAMGLVVFAVRRCCARSRPAAGCWWPPAACRASARHSWCRARWRCSTPGSPAPQQARAIGTWTAWTGTAFVVGPLLGGVLVDALNWRWVFGVNIVPLAVTLYLTTKLSHDEFGADGAAPIDVVGAVLTAVGLTGDGVRAHRTAAARACPTRRWRAAWWSAWPAWSRSRGGSAARRTR